jgi:hypothetical protein
MLRSILNIFILEILRTELNECFGNIANEYMLRYTKILTYRGQANCQISNECVLSLTTNETNKLTSEMILSKLMGSVTAVHTSCDWSSHPSQHALTSSLLRYSRSPNQFG